MKVFGPVAVACLALIALPAAAADAKHGKEVFERCAKCHSLADAGNDDSGNVGPTLKGVVGRKAASVEDFRYSGAMRQSGLTWTEDNLKDYIADPQAKVKGNRMAFTGTMEPADIQDVIAYLKSVK